MAQSPQLVDPRRNEYCPGEHPMHASAVLFLLSTSPSSQTHPSSVVPPGESESKGHARHPLACPSLYVPASHASQAVPVVADRYLPASQPTHPALLVIPIVVEYLPAPHARHSFPAASG